MSSPQEIIASQQEKIDRLTKQNTQLLNKIRQQVKTIDELRVENRELRKSIEQNAEKDANIPKISTKVEKGNAPVKETPKTVQKEAPGTPAKPTAASKVAKSPETKSSESDEEDTASKPLRAKLNPGAVPILPQMITPDQFDLMKEIRLKMMQRREGAESPVSPAGAEKVIVATPGSPSTVTTKYPNVPKPPPPVGKPVSPTGEEAKSTEETKPVEDMRKRISLKFMNKETPDAAPAPVVADRKDEKPVVETPTEQPKEQEKPPVPAAKAKPVLPVKKAPPPSLPPKVEKKEPTGTETAPAETEEVQQQEEASPPQQDNDTAPVVTEDKPKKSAPPPLPSKAEIQIDRSALFAEIRKGTGLKRVERAVPGGSPTFSPKSSGGVNPVLAQLQRRKNLAAASSGE